MKKLFVLIVFVFCKVSFSQSVPAMDTVSITLSEAEEQFLKNNYLLLAQKFNVDATKALTRQAGLFNNPNIYYENSIYNKFSGKYFPTQVGKWGDYTTQGEFVVQANWLFSIAGKRNKSVKFAKAQADIAQYQFDDLIRTLLFALRSDFYELNYGLRSLKFFNDEISSLGSLVTAYEQQYQKGNVSLRELTRIRALLLSLQSDRLELYTNLQESFKEFSVLLNNAKNVWYKPVLNEAETESKYPIAKVVLSDAVAQALTNRPDLKATQSQVTAADAYLKLQKAMGIPDITVQGVYDRNGSYIPNYSAAALSIPLAVFNRNQGNIQSAKLTVDAANQQLLQKQVSVQNDVFVTYQKILETEKLNSSLGVDFASDFATLLTGIESNFAKKNISLLEFVDLFQSYKESMMQYNFIKAQRLTAFEELNFNVGKDVFKQ